MNSICNIQEEQQKCINELVLENFDKKPIRGTLRLLEYNKWCQLQVHGKGGNSISRISNCYLIILGWDYPAQNGMMLLNSKEIMPL